MPAPAAKPVRSSTEEHKRARRIFARLIAGESMRAIAQAGSPKAEARKAHIGFVGRRRREHQGQRTRLPPH